MNTRPTDDGIPSGLSGPLPGIRLLIVTAALTLALAAGGALLARRQYDGNRQRQIDQSAILARAAAADADQFVRDRLWLLTTLALSPELRRGDAEAARAHFTAVRNQDPSLSDILWIDLDGAVRAHALDDLPGAIANVSDRDYFRAVVETNAPAVSAALVSRFSNRAVVVLAVPITDAGGKLTGVLALGLTLQGLEETLRAFKLGASDALLLVDRAGQLIVDADPRTGVIDVSASPLLARARRQGTGAVAGAVGLTGTPNRLVAFAPAPAAGWIVFVDRPAAEVFAAARRDFIVTLAVALVVALLGVAGAGATGRRLDRLALRERRALAGVMAENAERRRAEEALRLSEERFRSLVQNASDMIVVLSGDATLQYASPSVERVLGYRPEEWVGRNVFALIHPDDAVRVRDALTRVVPDPRSYGPIEFRLRRADGVWRYLEASATNLLHDPTVRGIVENIRDVTERRQVEEGLRVLAEAGAALASSLDYQITLARVARVAVPALADWCSVDIAGEDGSIHRLAVAAADPAKEELVQELRRRYPFTADWTRGVPRVIRSGEPELVSEVTDEQLAAGAIDGDHLRMLQALGMRSYLRVPLMARGRILGAISLVFAESGRRYRPADLPLAEALALRAALAVDNARLYQDAQDALRLREEFFSSVSHDLRTPLTAIKAYAQMLQKRAARTGAPETDVGREALAAIVDGATRMATQIGEMLDLSRLQSGRTLALDLTPTNLVALVQREVETARRTADRHTIEFAAAAPEITGLWDAHRLERVVGNLLSNAVKYSPTGGVIRVTVSRGDTAATSTSAMQPSQGSPPDAWAVLTVEDQGIGIPTADLPHIFERFHRGGNVSGIAGSGVGLAAVRQSVEQHGGAMTVESTEGKGTTVTIYLPLTARAA